MINVLQDQSMQYSTFIYTFSKLTLTENRWIQLLNKSNFFFYKYENVLNMARSVIGRS